jgi:hypothetical protein
MTSRRLRRLFQQSENSRERRGRQTLATPTTKGWGCSMSPFRSPKKPCQNAKHCPLCKKHEGMHVNKNTVDCSKYEKDGNMKKGFGKGQRNNTASNKKTGSAFAQLLVKVTQLEKANEKLRKSSKKCKHGYNSDSSDSNSS